jgi:hypothetical protein
VANRIGKKPGRVNEEPGIFKLHLPGAGKVAIVGEEYARRNITFLERNSVKPNFIQKLSR